MNTPAPRPVSVPHLVLGLVFTGIAAVWAVGQATDADLPQTAIGFPAVIIAAGVVGLVASVFGARRRAQALAPSSGAPDGTTDAVPDAVTDAVTDDTTVLTETPEDLR